MKNFNWRSLIAALCLLSFSPSVKAQITVPSSGTSSSGPFSPSITSFNRTVGSTTTKYVVSAYAYSWAKGSESPAQHRTIGVSSSTDGGVSWSTTVANMAFSISWSPSTSTAPIADDLSELDNMDDPQILSIGGGKLILVVRAWSDGSLYQAGAAYAGLPGTIFTHSGIFTSVSTDNGVTWGYFSGTGSSPVQGKWGEVAYDAASSLTTIEYPRITYRPGFDSKGYIVWDQKTWSNGATATFTLIPTSGGGTWTDPSPGYRITNSQIGISAFSASLLGNNGNGIPDGELYSTGGSNSYYFPNTATTDINHPYAIAAATPAEALTLFGPESPSVAISPDKGIWLGYQQINYNLTDENDAYSYYFDDQRWYGNREVEAFMFVARATCCISTTNIASFSSVNQSMLFSDELLGFYNSARGYTYGKALTDPIVGGGGSPLLYSDIDAPLAQGPSIQIACANTLGCLNYTFGFVQAFGDGSHGDVDPLSPRTWLCFFSEQVPSGGDATLIKNNLPFTPGDFGHPTGYPNHGFYGNQIETDHANYYTDGGNHYDTRFFPSLKYVGAPDPMVGYFPDQNGSNNPSFFALSYMSVYQDNSSNSHTGTSYLNAAACKTAVSYDNVNFSIHNYVTTLEESLVRDAEDYTPSTAVAPQYWGSKIDVCGDAGDFAAHPVWHSIAGVSSSETLKGNTAGCMLFRAYRNDLMPSDPNAFVTAISNGGGIFRAPNVTTGSYYYGPLGLFDFYASSGTLFNSSGVSQVNSISATGALGSPFAPIETPSFLPSLPTSAIPTGIYYALYNASPTPQTPDIGNLGYSSQRHIVMTGNTAHAVADQGVNGGIWYSQAFQVPTLTTQVAPIGTLMGWTAPFNLCDPTTGTGTTANVPNVPGCAIGVYQRGDPSNGESTQKAMAVCWISQYSGAYGGKIAVRLNEGDGCEFATNDWSPVYIFDIPTSSEELTLPVLTPLEAPVPGSATGESYLVGWTITCSDAISGPSVNSVNYITLLRSDFCGNVNLRNENWGVYRSTPNLAPSTGFGQLYSHSLSANDPFFEFTSTVVNQSRHPAGGLVNTNSQEVAVSTEGLTPGLWVMTATYDVATTPGVATSTSLLTPLTIPVDYTHGGAVEAYVGQWDRNPSITINSSGQKFVAWEHMEGLPYGWITGGGGGHPSGGFSSSIRIAHTDFKSLLWLDNFALKDIQDWYSEATTDAGFHWLVNPSITAYPMTRVTNTSNPVTDQDPGAVELLFTQQDYVSSPGVVSTANMLHEFLFWQQPGDPLTGTFGHTEPGGFPTSGINAQRSFCNYCDGPRITISSPLPEQTPFPPLAHSYGIGNKTGTGLTNKFVMPDLGSYSQKGTYATNLGVELYRAECRGMGNSTAQFTWGSVYVEDTTLTLPIRQIMLNPGKSDTNGFATHTAMRDSLFQTEWFDWPVSAQINYARLLMLPGNTYGDSGFYGVSASMNYIVQLAHANGRIDTIEQLRYVPDSGIRFNGSEVHIVNANGTPDTVMLFVTGSMVNIPDADSMCIFARETMFGTYATYSDTTIAISSSSGTVPPPPPTTCLTAMGPYPNPTHVSSANTSILFHYCSTGTTVTTKIYNVLGAQIGSTISTTSNGQEWQRVAIPTPSTSGTYFVKVSDGSTLVTLSMSVI